MKQTMITTGGQVSIPAEVRNRWGTRRLVVEDRGTELAFRPMPDDPIGAARGVLRGLEIATPTSGDVRRQTRQEEDDSTSVRGVQP